ncbi:MAG: carboxypeptidase regulatory-like domain-containing protein [Ruminococcus sp.]|nr:carboxypeptidase regulatory-like domain-containing protein [Ruminococcus sp.]
MDKRDIASQAEKYKREMMKLYGRSTVQENDDEAVPVVNVRPEADEPPEAPPEPEREIKTEPETEYEPESEDNDMTRRYPDPDLSELETDFGESPEENGDETPEYVSEESIGTEKGYIQVNVRTGDDSEPIQGADVQVTAVVDGNLMILASGATDESGAAPLFEVPVPSISYSQTPDPTVRPYSLFDVSVTARGFFNARSVDVPVFEGITSVQSFSMIPTPLFMNSGDETVTSYNQEPNL